MSRLPVQVMKISDTLYAVDMGDGILEVEMIETKKVNGKILHAYTMTSTNNAINGYFENQPGNDPVPLIENLVEIYLKKRDYENGGEA
jgi:hypothetical protein